MRSKTVITLVALAMALLGAGTSFAEPGTLLRSAVGDPSSVASLRRGGSEYVAETACRALVERFMGTGTLLIEVAELAPLYDQLLKTDRAAPGGVEAALALVGRIATVSVKRSLADDPRRKMLLMNMCASSAQDRIAVVESINSLVDAPSVSLDDVLRALPLEPR